MRVPPGARASREPQRFTRFSTISFSGYYGRELGLLWPLTVPPMLMPALGNVGINYVAPLVVAKLRRPTDRLVLMETQPKEADALRAALGRAKLVSVLESDGYAALKAHLPPRENRGLVLIDPPYESDAEFDRVLAGLELAHERWPLGTYCVWYPLTDRAGPVRFHRELERSGLRKVLDVHLNVLPTDTQVGLAGAGLVILNPPWMLDDRLKELMPQLHRLLSPEGLGGASVEWLVPE